MLQKTPGKNYISGKVVRLISKPAIVFKIVKGFKGNIMLNLHVPFVRREKFRIKRRKKKKEKKKERERRKEERRRKQKK